MSLQVPSDAVSNQDDILDPTQRLLIGLSLLGGADDGDKADGPMSTFSGPPQSVALIEAGATAAAKWWATGLGTAAIAAWGAIKLFWGNNPDVHVALVSAGAIVSAALIVALGFLLASDVRGRALAAAATIEARSRVAIAMLGAAESLYERPPAKFTSELVPLSPAREVVNREASRDDELGWEAVALQRQEDGAIGYVVVKGSTQMTLSVDDLIFVGNGAPEPAERVNGGVRRD